MAIEPMEGEPQAPAYPQNRFVVLLIVLAVLVAMVGVAQRIPTPATEEPQFSEKTLEGDTAMKFAYASERWKSFLSHIPAQRQQMEVLYYRQRLSAIASYRQAIEENPSPQNIRRLIIIEYPGKRAELISKLGKTYSTPWLEIYVEKSPLSPREVAAYASRIRKLDLGWYESLALADLYARGGLSKEARAEHEKAVNDAVRTVVMLVALLAVVGILGFIGISVIALYIIAGVAGKLPVEEPIPPEYRQAVAGWFLEAFVFYLAVVIGTQVLAGVALASKALIGGSLSPETIVFATAGVYTIGGAIAVIYLAYRLRAAGFSWKTVGLTSKNPLLDVGWGILGYAAALPMLLIASLLSQVIARYIPTPSNPIIPIFLQSNTLFERLILLALTIVVAPFFEELFFRGVLFHSFQAKWGVRLGLVISAVVFAAVHPLPLGFLPIFVLGYVLATLLYRRGSLLPCMVMHGLNNCIAFLVLSILTRP